MADIELHVHPYLGKNTIRDVAKAMDARKIDILAMEALDSSIFPSITELTRKEYGNVLSDPYGIRLPNGKFFLNAQEYSTKEDIHVLTVGYSMGETKYPLDIRRIIDKGLSNDAFVLIDHPFVDNKYTRTAGHISDRLEKELEKICKEYPSQLALEWNAYCIPWMRFALKQGLNMFGQEIKYHDVNRKAHILSSSLKDEGYTIPVVADTDLHARNKSHLKYMGTSRIIAPIKGETPKDMLQSIRKKIFSGEYENVERYVSSMHLLEAFCLPVLFPKRFYKPRA